MPLKKRAVRRRQLRHEEAGQVGYVPHDDGGEAVSWEEEGSEGMNEREPAEAGDGVTDGKGGQSGSSARQTSWLACG